MSALPRSKKVSIVVKIAAIPELEDCGAVSAFLQRDQLLLEDFGIGMIQACVDQIGAIVAKRIDFPEHYTERAFRCLRTGKHKGGTSIHRWACRTDR